jgi:hypothetical protein
MSNVVRRFLSATAGALVLLVAVSANANMVLEMDVVYCGTPGAGNPDKGMQKGRYTIKDAAAIVVATQPNVSMFIDQGGARPTSTSRSTPLCSISTWKSSSRFPTEETAPP